MFGEGFDAGNLQTPAPRVARARMPRAAAEKLDMVKLCLR